MAEAVSDLDHPTGGVALAEPPSSAPTVRIPTWRDLTIGDGPEFPRYLPEVLADSRPLIEVGTSIGLGVVGRIAVANGPIAGMVAGRDGRLVVTNYGDDSVSVIDTAGGTVAKTLTGLYEPFAIATASADVGRVYLSAVSPAYDAIAVLDVDTEDLIAAYPQAGSVRDVVVRGDGKLVYASRTGVDGADVVVLDPATGRVEAIDVAEGATADRVAISADGRRLYVAIQRPAGSAVAVIDTDARRVVGTFEIGSSVRDIAVSRDGGIAYVAGCGPDAAAIDIVDTRTGAVSGTVGMAAVGGAVTQLVLSHDGERVYLVTDSGVTVLSTLTHGVVGALSLDTPPSCVVESADGGSLYVADYAGAVTVVSIVLTAAPLVGAVMAPAGLFEQEPVLV